jgi:LSD1 subclass zinc finger protein
MQTEPIPTTSNIPTAELVCQQCAAPLRVSPGSQFVTCEFCGTDNFVDKSGVVIHYAVQTTVREPDAVAALRRWMAGNQTVKGLDEKAQITETIYQLFPMWMVRVQANGEERIYLEPAAATSITELTELTIPAGSITAHDHALDTYAIDPTVPYETVKSWLADNHKVSSGAIRSVSLVHVPIYICKYTYEGEGYTAVIDGATSQVFAAIYPSKWETPYRTIGGLGCLGYFLISLIPLVGFASASGSGAAVGMTVYCFLAVLLAIPIFAAAVFISSKA